MATRATEFDHELERRFDYTKDKADELLTCLFIFHELLTCFSLQKTRGEKLKRPKLTAKKYLIEKQKRPELTAAWKFFERKDD